MNEEEINRFSQEGAFGSEWRIEHFKPGTYALFPENHVLTSDIGKNSLYSFVPLIKLL